MSGRICTWFPHYKQLMWLATQLNWPGTASLANCRKQVRTLQVQLKARGHKATLKQLTADLQCAVRLRWHLKSMRSECRRIEPTPPLEQRIIDRFYAPYKEDIRRATTAANSKTTITITRGAPAVKYWKKVHGYGWGRWEEACLAITLPRGWPKLAAVGKHIIQECTELRPCSLIVEWTPETPPDDLFGPQHQFRAGLARVVLRGVGTKTISEPIIMAEHAGVWVAANTLSHALQKLPAEVVKQVSSRLN